MKVAAVDDVPDELESLEGELEEAGHQVVPRQAPLQSLGSLKAWLMSQRAEALVCDQRLSGSAYATFQGSEAISFVTRDLRLPSLLVSSYVETATDLLSIRQLREHIPVVIEKSRLTPKRLNNGFYLSQSELNGDIPLHRIPRRTGIYIEGFSTRTTDILDVIVPGWDDNVVVSIPLHIIEDRSIREDIRKGSMDWLIAKVNVDAESGVDLFFKDFERAPNSEGVWEKLWHQS